MSTSYFELVDAFHPALARLDYAQTRVKLLLIGVSFVVWASIYFLSALLASFTTTYRRLKTKEKVFWNLAVVRASFGFFCTAVGIWAIFTETPMDKVRCAYSWHCQFHLVFSSFE